MKNNFFKFSKKEKIDLLKGWGAISIAFGIVLNSSINNILYSILISAITVGVGFIAHELSHKYLAQKYGCIAEFRSNDTWLILAIVMSFFGFIFAAPGGVYIAGHIDKIRNGRISSSGIISNLILGLFFLGLFFIPQMQIIGYYGLFINSLLALFNLIPIMNFDGKKVLSYNKKLYIILLISGIILMGIHSALTI